MHAHLCVFVWVCLCGCVYVGVFVWVCSCVFLLVVWPTQAGLASIKALEFTMDQAVQMVSNEGGAENLPAIKENLQPLLVCGYDAVPRLPYGAVRACATLACAVPASPSQYVCCNTVIHPLAFACIYPGYTLHVYAAAELQRVLLPCVYLRMRYMLYPALPLCFLAHVLIAALRTAHCALRALLLNHRATTAALLLNYLVAELSCNHVWRRFDRTQIVQMVSHNGGKENLAEVNNSLGALTRLGLTSKQIIKVASRGGGSKNLLAIKENSEALKAVGLSLDQIVKIGCNEGASKSLVALKDDLDILKDVGFSSEQVST